MPEEEKYWWLWSRGWKSIRARKRMGWLVRPEWENQGLMLLFSKARRKEKTSNPLSVSWQMFNSIWSGRKGWSKKLQRLVMICTIFWSWLMERVNWVTNGLDLQLIIALRKYLTENAIKTVWNLQLQTPSKEKFASV